MILHENTVNKKTVNKLVLAFDEDVEGKVVSVKAGNKVICKRNITGGRTKYNVVFQNTTSEDKDIVVLIDTAVPKDKIVSCYVKEICGIYEDNEFQTTEQSVTAAIATYPAREKIIPKAIDSLIDQVDHLYLYLNNYQEVPDFIKQHPKSEKISFIIDSASIKRAAAKFFWVNRVKGIHLTCDDDITYPKDYVKKLSSQLSKLQKKSIVGVHSVIYKETANDPISSRKHVFNFKEKSKNVQKVHLLGTGTLCFNTNTLNLKSFNDIWSYAASTDEWLACFAKKQSIGMFSIPRKKNWMLSIEGMEHGLNEEKQLNKDLRAKASLLISNNSPWSHIDKIDKDFISDNRKVRKLVFRPREFFVDIFNKKGKS